MNDLDEKPQDQTYAELATLLGVSYRALMGYRHQPDAPGSPLSVGEWKQWMRDNGKGTKSAPEPAETGNGIELPGSCSYDKAIKEGYSPAAALRREKVRQVELQNQKAALELQRERGELFNRAQVRAELERITDLCISSLERNVPEYSAGLVEPHAQADARKKAKGLISKIRAEVAAALKV